MHKFMDYKVILRSISYEEKEEKLERRDATSKEKKISANSSSVSHARSKVNK